ncbi:WDGH domain-containing protein, partial [Mycobacterium kansasii]
ISHLGDKGNISDGSHTFNDLYYQRAVLFAVICNSHKNSAWKSWKHGDGTKNKDYFVAGVNTPEGHFNYYFHKDYWELFRVEELKVY